MTTAALRPVDRARHALVLASLGTLPQPTGEPVLVLVSGLPGAGKSTFSRRLAPSIGAVILESDAVRRLLFTTPVYSNAENAALFRTVHRSARMLLQRGIAVIIDATSLREAHRRPLAKLALAVDARFVHVRMTAPEETILRRLDARREGLDGNDRSFAGIGVYLRMKQDLEPVRGPHRLVDSTDNAAYDAALHEIACVCLALRPVAAELTGGRTGGKS